MVSKIVKHCRDSLPATANGLLVGIDFDGTLQVTNCIPLPHSAFDGEDADKSAKALARYQATMLRSLRDVQIDDGVVGFYQSITFNGFYTHNLVESQAIHQDKLRHGGIAIVHGAPHIIPNNAINNICLFLVIDSTKAAQGNASFRAYKLTKNFLRASKKGKFSRQR